MSASISELSTPVRSAQRQSRPRRGNCHHTWHVMSASLSMPASISDLSTLVVPTSTGRPVFTMRFISVTTADHLPASSQPVYQSVRPSFSQSVRPSVSQSVSPSGRLSLSHSGCQTVRKSHSQLAHQSVSQSVSQSDSQLLCQSVSNFTCF